ncbi:MAG: RHS repeat-associated core domain-containing protein [Bacilli bacterium]|nr:RHS repeat-associated core domain-containing protein [Bacilli bacterium]
MFINNIEDYLTFYGLIIYSSDNTEEEIEYHYVGSLNDDELLVEFEFDLQSLCSDYNLNLNDISNIKLVFDGSSSNIQKIYFCNEYREVIQVFDNDGQAEFNLGYIKNNNNFDGFLYFSIRSSDASDYQTVDVISCEIILNYTNNFNNKPAYKTKFLSSTIDNLLTYNIDLYTGRIDFSRSIISLYGNKMPLELSESYNQFKDTNFFGNRKLNLEQKLYFSDGNYYWIDNKYKTHQFEQINNSLYFDTEHTGLLLRIYANEFVITNDVNKFIHFDASMNLVSIESKRGVDSLFLQISQSSNGLVFTDGMGRCASYIASDNSHILTLPDSTVLNFYSSANQDVFSNIDGSQITYKYKDIQNIKLLISASSNENKSVKFTYDEKYRIIKIEEFSSNLISKRTIIEYFNHYTIVTKINHPSDLLISERTGYFFAKNGEAISELDLYKYEYNKESDIYYYNEESYEQLKFEINTNDAINITRVEGTNYFGINTTSLNEDEEYVVYAKLNNEKLHISNVNDLEVILDDVWPACYFVRRLFYINYSFDGELTLAAKIRPSEYTNEYIILEVGGSQANLVDNYTFYLTKVKRSNSFDVIRSSSQSGDFTERRNNQTRYWNKLYSLKFSNYQDCEKITLKDFNISYLNLLRNNQVILRYNDLSKAILYNNQNVIINDDLVVEFSNLLLGHLDLNLGEKTFYYLEGENELNFSFYKIINKNRLIKSGLVKQKIDFYGNKIEEEDSLGNITNYTLDNFGRTLAIAQITSQGVFKTESNYSYLSNEFKEIKLDEDGLIYESTYDLLTGLLKSHKEPNGNYIYYQYDTHYRLVSVSSSNNTNSISYNKQNISALNSSDGNNFSFSYNYENGLNAVKVDNLSHLDKSYVKAPNKDVARTLYSNSKGDISLYNRFGKLVQKGQITSLYSNGIIGMNKIYGDIGGNYSNINNYDFNDRNISSQSPLRKVVFTNLTNPYVINYSYNVYGKINQVNIPNKYNCTYSYTNFDLLNGENISFTIFGQNIFSTNNYSFVHIDALNSARLGSFASSISGFEISDQYTYDNSSRIVRREILLSMQSYAYGQLSINYEYTYKSRSENNLTLLSNKLLSRRVTIIQDTIDNYSEYEDVETFTYDNNGNLASITTNNYLDRFTYDNLNRLVREDNQALNRTFVYAYNNGGNITFKVEYNYTTGNLGTPINVISYGYNSSSHKDMLISWNGYNFSYDAAGNPLTYKGCSLTRNSSNRLSKYSYNAQKYIEFEYNAIGERREKVYHNGSSTIRHTYTYLDNKILAEEITSNSENKAIIFIYEKDEIIGFYDRFSLPYLYRKNILGDVIEINDYYGDLVAEYKYDAWGNCTVTNHNEENIGDLNPIRYRSYYFDNETGLYYLINRYYDPKTGRFISPDSIDYLDYKLINGLNLYCYCLNNPIIHTDKLGTISILSILIVLASVVIICYGLGRIILDSSKNNDKAPDDWNGEEFSENFEGKISKNFENYTIYFEITNTNQSDINLYNLTIYDSWKYSASQIRQFLNWLKDTGNFSTLNVDKMLNERARHKLAYEIGFKYKHIADADIFLNSDDVDHWYSFIINGRLWY